MRSLLVVVAVMVGGCAGHVDASAPEVRCGDIVVTCCDGHGGSPAVAYTASSGAGAEYCDGANLPAASCSMGEACVAIVDGASTPGTCR